MFVFFTIMMLALIISFHEFGHFLVAKIFKVQVQSFNVGISTSKKPLFYFLKTPFYFSFLLIGGAVVFAQEKTDDQSYLYSQLAPWKKSLITIAGPLFNFILSFIFIFGLFFFSYKKDFLNQNNFWFTLTEDVVFINELKEKVTLSKGDLIVFHDQKDKMVVTEYKTSFNNDELYQNVQKNSVKANLNLVNFISISFNINNQIILFAIKETIKIFSPEGIKNISSIVGFFSFSKKMDDSADAKFAEDEEKNSLSKKNDDKKDSFVFKLIFWLLVSSFLVPLLSISIGVFNLLPIPSFDGGKIVGQFFTQILLWFRFDLSKNWFKQLEIFSNGIGFVLILCIFFIAFKNDISNIWKKEIEKTYEKKDE